MGTALDPRLLDRPSRLDPASRRERRRLRRELVRRDARSARLAELVAITEVLVRAVEVVERGWLQHAWFSYRTPQGQARVSYVADRGRAAGGSVLSTCLVAAIRGSAPASEQVLARTLEVTWHALHLGPGHPVRWCPAPDVRIAHLRDLTGWNDRPGRTSTDVVALLRGAIQIAEGERSRVLAG